MACTEHHRLFEIYYERVTALSRAVGAMRDADRSRGEQARAVHFECEKARLILERHEREHG